MTASRPPRRIVTIYQLILGGYPARIRRQFGEEQLQLFEDLWREERPSGRVSGTLWTLGQFWRAIRVGLVCHFDNRRRLNAMSRQSWALPIDRFRPWLSDLRLGARAVRRSPWYSLTSILVLASGVALTTVVFAMVDGVLFRPLPYARADQLFLVRAASTPGRRFVRLR